MPPSAALDPSNHSPGDFSGTSLFEVQKFLSSFAFVDYHKGTIPQTLQSVENRLFAFVHIDVDLYESAKSCCAFFYPRLSKGGMMIFDDYGFLGYAQSAKRAVDEFFDDKPEEPIVFPTGQSLIIKTAL
jgi:O-methyltransferase